MFVFGLFCVIYHWVLRHGQYLYGISKSIYFTSHEQFLCGSRVRGFRVVHLIALKHQLRPEGKFFNDSSTSTFQFSALYYTGTQVCNVAHLSV